MVYTLEALIPMNASYHESHRVVQADVDMVNRHIAFIESSRTGDKMQVGDIVEYTTKHGDFYRYAHLEKYESDTDSWSVCEQPQIPFIYISHSDGVFSCSTSGGAWCSIPNNLKLIGRRKKYFKDWSRWGACKDGAVCFEALVNAWEYTEPGALYGDYTTKHYRKHYISLCVDELGLPKNGSLYRYFGDGMAFTVKADYEAWRDTYRGVEFPGHSENQTVIFNYKSIEKYVSESEYDSLNLPVDTRMCNGIIEAKVLYDDEARTVTEYRHTNDGSKFRGRKPYELIKKGAVA